MTDEAHTPESYDARQERRLGALPGVYKTQHERLAFELALAQPIEAGSVFANHGYTQEQSIGILSDPTFAKLLERVTKEVKENGLSFRNKARMQAEDLLQHSYALATDPEVSSAVRLDAIKSTVKWAGLEPKEKDDKGTGTGGLTLNISFAGQAPQQVVGHEPVTIEAER